MKTLSEIMEKLRVEKNDNEFRMTNEGFKAVNSDQVFKPDDLLITKTYRFEGMSDPADNSILYIIEANNGLKGYALDAYGTYSNYDNAAFDDFLAKVPVHEAKEEK
ncbi:hypothetical protein [Solitalea canadensis]|nr:hypothetical protein [Solitalea canadensis]